MGSYLRYLSENATELIFYAQQHFLLVGYSVALASVISLVLALVLHTNQLTPPSWRRSLQVGSRETALLFASAALTIPSLALFGMLQPLLGLGVTPSIVALTKVLVQAMGPWAYGVENLASPGWVGIVAVIAAVTMTYGNFAALAQKNLKRMLAYSSIAHAGYMLVGVLAVEYSAFSIDGRPDLSLVIYNPATPKDVNKIRALLRSASRAPKG